MEPNVLEKKITQRVCNWAYCNGQIMPLAEVKISALDRGFLFGDSVYESIPVYHRKPRCLDRHLMRLQRSLDKINIDVDCKAIQLEKIIIELIDRNEIKHQSVYLQISRGNEGYRCHEFSDKITPTIFIFAQPLRFSVNDADFSGYSVFTAKDTRWQYTNIKTTNLLPNILLLQVAAERKADEVILIRNGNAVEGTCSNIFLVKNNCLITPPEQDSMLSGITREIILKLAKQHAIKYEERDIGETELHQADELWFTNSIDGVAPIISLDGKIIADGKPGFVWRKMFQFYNKYVTTP